ncbi:MAG: DNA polymerase III subunit delta' [Nitrospirae bacterium]|nr:DNA polymerase III subunit delta' [Nitrospirota bacterium]
MALRDIIGQEKAVEILRGCMERNRIGHAFVFTGDDGIGKKLTAINFIKTLNCQNSREALDVMRDGLKDKNSFRITDHALRLDCCDQCSSCLKINKLFYPEALISPGEKDDDLRSKIYLSHPDVVLAIPFNGEIRVDITRKIEEFLSYKAFEGRWKAVIIDGAETLNQSAANALLKTLEEPPEQSILILISPRPELLPKTILSRCQRIFFSPLPINKMSALLEDKSDSKNLQPETAVILSMLSGGRPGLALNDELLEKRDSLFLSFQQLLEKIDEDPWEEKDSEDEWFAWVHLWLRDIAVLKATGRTDLLINRDREKDLRVISKKAELHDILTLSNTFSRIRDSLRFNLNKRVVLYHTHLLLKKTFGGSGA